MGLIKLQWIDVDSTSKDEILTEKVDVGECREDVDNLEMDKQKASLRVLHHSASYLLTRNLTSRAQ